MDDRHLFVRSFRYVRSGPSAYFWVGFEEQPSPRGKIVPFPPEEEEEGGRRSGGGGRGGGMALAARGNQGDDSAGVSELNLRARSGSDSFPARKKQNYAY